MADYDLGTAKGKIVIDSSGVDKGIDSAGRSIDELDKKAGKSKGNLQALEKSLLAVGVAGVAAFGFAINKAADFEETLSGIKAVSGATEAQMESLRKKALQLGADTAFSAGEAAQAMEELSKSGLSVAEIMNGAADATVNLAAAGEVSLPEAATIAANAMNQFGLAAEDLPHVADLIAGAANASAISVSDFGMSMAQAGASANLTGLSFDDMALAITAMGNAGIKGSDAGTSLKTFLSGLQPVTEKQTQLFYDLGLAVEGNSTAGNEMGNSFFDAQGKVKPMEEIAGALEVALAGMSDAQKAATLEMIFGSDAVRAAAIIAETGAAGFDELATSMGSISAADVAATRLDNFNGSMEQLKGSMETTAINIGTLFLPALRDIADQATIGVNKFGELDDSQQKWIVGAAAGTVAAAGLAGGLGLMIHQMAPVAQGIGQVIGGIGSMGSSLLSLASNPVVLVIAAIAALVAGFIYFYTHSKSFRETVDKIIDKVQIFAGMVKEAWDKYIYPALSEIGSFLQDVVWPIYKKYIGFIVDVVQGIIDFFQNDLVPGVKAAWDAVAKVAMDFWDWFDANVISTVRAAIELIIAIFDKIRWFVETILMPALELAWNLLVPIVEFVFNAIKTVIETALNIIMGIITFIVDGIMLAWNLFGDNILAAAELVWNAIKAVIEFVLGIIRGIIQVVTGLITGDWDKAWQGIKTLVETIWNGIQAAIQFVVDAIKLVISTFIDSVKFVLETGWNAIKLVVETVWNAIKAFIDIIWEGIKTAIQTAIDLVKGVITNTLDAIKATWELVWGNISSFFTGIWDDIKGAVTGAIDTITGALQGAWDTITGAVETAWDAVWDTVSGVIDDIVEAVTGLPDKLLEWVGDLLSAGADLGGAIIDGIMDGISAAGEAISDVAGAIFDAFKSGWNTVAQGINDFIPNDIGFDTPFGRIGVDLPDDPIPTFHSGGTVPGAPGKEVLALLKAGEVVRTAQEEELLRKALLGMSGMFSESYAPSSPYMSTSTRSSGSPAISGAPSSVTGVAIAEANFYDAVDVQTLMTQADYAIQGVKL